MSHSFPVYPKCLKAKNCWIIAFVSSLQKVSFQSQSKVNVSWLEVNPDRRFNGTRSCWSTFYTSGLEMPQSFSLQLGGMDWPFRTLTSWCFIYRQSRITPWIDLSKHNHSFRLECKLLARKKTGKVKVAFFSEVIFGKLPFACHDRVWWIVFHFNLRPAVLLELSCIFNKLLRIPKVI